MAQTPNNLSPQGTPIPLPAMKPIWRVALIFGAFFWIIAVIVWFQKGVDEAVLFYFNPMRVAYTPLVKVSEWLSAYGMAAMTVIYLGYFLASQKFKRLDAPLTIYLFIIISMGLTGIAGDLLKEVFARPRPIETYVNQIIVYSNSSTPAMPSGHTTKSVALALPFLLLVSSQFNGHKVLKGLLITLALGVSFSRIVIGAHYLSDVLGGIGMAFIGLPFSMLFAMMILKQSTLEQLPMMSKIWAVLLIALTVVFMVI